MPEVLNKHRDGTPAGAVYIGRGSKWGNPFRIGPDGDREEVIHKYIGYLFASSELYWSAKEELQGKDLVCFCAPQACHGDILLRVANSWD